MLWRKVKKLIKYNLKNQIYRVSAQINVFRIPHEPKLGFRSLCAKIARLLKYF